MAAVECLVPMIWRPIFKNELFKVLHEKCLLNPCNVVAQWVTSQPVTVDLTLTCFS